MEPQPYLEEPAYRYVIGVDLGTTNSAVAYVDLESKAKTRKIKFFEVPQLVGPGEVARESVLPSFLYLPGEYDLPPEATVLPWDESRDYVVGAFAREQGARVPGRLVASAKSWLSYSGVDRRAAILPWGAPDEVDRVSPVEASRRYLEHLREAWNARMARGRKSYLFENQRVILTVPASFDEVARELTVQAARDAGLDRVVLLEEPLAAFYAWLSKHEKDWQKGMADGQLILVCDVGGGTSDFSVVGIREGEQGLRFDRLAVGDHLLLGGDNMDLALGRYVEAQLLGKPGALDAQRWPQLVYQCRRAKEILLSDPEKKSVDVTVMGRAGQLIGGTLKGTLTADEVRRLLLDGFFPETSLDAEAEAPRAGLTELGLPYVADPAITRHLAAFWRRFQAYLGEETGREAPFPDFVLFNGGALTPGTVRARIREVVGQWFEGETDDGWQPSELDNPKPELAVAAGAAYYGLVRLGEGVRVGSGSPRAYYVGVAGEGDGAGQKAVCLVPRGTEEGAEIHLGETGFEALTNQPVAFHVFTSSTRLGDGVGDVVTLDPEEISILPPIRTVLRFGKTGEAKRLPVTLAVRLTEIGTLELWCQSQQTEHRWQLQFDVRQEVEAATPTPSETLDEALIEAARAEIENAFAGIDSDHKPARLRRALEGALDLPKKDWPTLLVRKLADAFLEHAEGRTLTEQHEERWLNLLGFCLRPGFGDPVDEWRMKQVWPLDFEGLAHARQPRCRAEWWIFWRRVAGGLSEGQQRHIYLQVKPYLEGGKKKPSRMFPKRIDAREEREVWMMLANFEWLAAADKASLGRRLLQQIKKEGTDPQLLWALSRFGARAPFYGPVDRVVAPSEAAAWAEALLKLKADPPEPMAHALVLLTRRTGDRARDVSEDTRAHVAEWLERLPNADHFRDLLDNPESARRQDEQDWMFGEALPAGLALFAEV